MRQTSFLLLIFLANPAPLWATPPEPSPSALPTALTIDEPIQPIPIPEPPDARRQTIIALGARLFADPRLSSSDTTACITCHSLSRGGADKERYSRRSLGDLTLVNTPTIFNLPLNFRLLWNGRIRNLEEHIRADPLRDAGTHWAQALGKLKRDAVYPKEFAALYPDGLTIANIQDAIVAFEESLITPNSRFDRYLRGEKTAISEREAQGYALFKSYGCTACHQGANVGGNLFQRFGVMGDYFADRGQLTEADAGRYNVTKREVDRHVFRVPSLRLVTLTAPYFHDGSAPTLQKAIKVMAKYQLGRPISDAHIELIIDFLKTLPGEYQGRLLVPENYP